METKTKKILFVEDDSLIVKIYDTRLGIEGYQVIWAEDGQAGKDLYLKEQPDLIVLDLMIPKISGLDLLKYIRERDHRIPIIIYSVLSGEERIKKLKLLGVTDYFIKSDTHPRELVERIKSYLT